MESDNLPENPTSFTSEAPAAALDDTTADTVSGSSTPQRAPKGSTDWLAWDETGRRSTASFVVRLFAFW